MNEDLFSHGFLKVGNEADRTTIAAILYKNDYTQTNRDELLRAVNYYDSLVAEDGSHADADLLFLDARTHYIYGVGYYEMDSAVPACEHYLKAVELMEEQFSEKELIGEKAQFMALAYTRLTVLFSDLYLHEQAIDFGKQSLLYYKRYEATSWHISWMLNKIGLHYDMIEQRDSANHYYNNALETMSDTNCLNYRDIVAARLFLSYRSEEPVELSLNQMRNLIANAAGTTERLSRYLSMGEIYFQEKQWDSASYYLKAVYDSTSSPDIKIW